MEIYQHISVDHQMSVLGVTSYLILRNVGEGEAEAEAD